MRLLIKGRASSKTTGLINASEVTGYPIVVHDYSSVNNVKQIASEMGCTIPEPVTVYELRDGSKRGDKMYEHVLVDELGFFIDSAIKEYLGVDVVAATMTDPSK